MCRWQREASGATGGNGRWQGDRPQEWRDAANVPTHDGRAESAIQVMNASRGSGRVRMGGAAAAGGGTARLSFWGGNRSTGVSLQSGAYPEQVHPNGVSFGSQLGPNHTNVPCKRPFSACGVSATGRGASKGC